MSTQSFLDKAPFIVLPALSIPSGLGAGVTGFDVGPLNLKAFANGRLRGSVHQDRAGALVIEQGVNASDMDLDFTVVRDTSVGDFQYPFDVIILLPFVRISFVNGGAASSFFRALIQALPI